MGIGGIIGAVTSAVNSVITQKIDTGTINWKSVAVAAGSGFASGVVAASPLGLPEQVGIGALIGGVTYVVDCTVNSNDNFSDIKADELIVSAVAGAASGYIGGAGANEYNVLTNTVKTSMKTTIKFSAKNTGKFAAKRMAEAISWRNNRLAVSAWSSSARFAAGIGASNAIVNVWINLKNWVLGLINQ